MKEKQAIKQIKQIYDAHKSGAGICWGDLAFLQDNHALIKSSFVGEIGLYELAGIPESEI